MDTDFHELIELYKKLTNDYEGTLNEITEVRRRLDEYQNSMTTYINQQVDSRVQTAVNSFGSTIESDLNSIRTSVSNLNNKVESYFNTLNALAYGIRDDLEGEIQSLHQYDQNLLAQLTSLTGVVSANHTQLQRDMQTLNSELKSAMEETKAYILSKLSEENERVLSESALYTAQQINALDYKLSQQIQEISSASGHKAIKWLWQYGCYHGGFSAMEWYELSMITAQMWNCIDVTCLNWYVDAKEILRRFDSRNKMYSPVSGKFVDVKVALMELAVVLNINAMTAEEYDSLGLTADEYDRFFATAQEYDWGKKGEKLCTVNKPSC